MTARIYQPARNAMTSGQMNTRQWVLEYVAGQPRGIDPLMGWTSSADTQAQVSLTFDTKAEALAYARANGIEAIVTRPKKRAPIIRAGGYGENFAPNRRGAWTH